MQLNASGPAYPDLGNAVAKYRRMATKAGSLSDMLPADRRAYGEAVEKAIRAKQRSELQRELPSHAPNCASGTAHNTGEAIHRAMQAKHRAALLACPSQIRRARKPWEWQSKYNEAMEEKAFASLPWSRETWERAHTDNRRLNQLIAQKWADYDWAWMEHADMSYDEACRDN